MSLYIMLSLVDTDNEGKVSVTNTFTDEEEKLLRRQPSLYSITTEALFEIYVQGLGERMLRYMCDHGLPAPLTKPDV